MADPRRDDPRRPTTSSGADAKGRRTCDNRPDTTSAKISTFNQDLDNLGQDLHED
jgi:hypothetical protein